MSRTKAKNELSLDQYKEEMAGVYTTSVNENTLDEAPMAYKSLEDIIDVIRESVDVIDVIIILSFCRQAAAYNSKALKRISWSGTNVNFKMKLVNN